MKDIKREKISFVIPCYNSTNTIARVVEEIIQVMDTVLYEYNYEIVLVNDGSPDGTTYQKICELANNGNHIKGYNLARNFGQPGAVMAALSQTEGDYIVCGDDDGQTPFEELPKLMEKIKEGYDVVEAMYTVREKRSLLRKFGTWMNECMATWLVAKPKGLVLTSYWVTKRYVVEQMLTYKNAYPYIGGLMLRTTQNACNVGVPHRARLSGKSGYSIQKMVGLWLNGFTSFSVKPLRIMTGIGIIISCIGFIYGILIIIRKLCDETISVGYSSIMAVNLFMFGTMFFFMGFIGEYIGRMYLSLNNTPQYIIKESIMSDDLLHE